MTESTELRDAVRDLKGSIDQLRTELVRKDVYEAEQKRIYERLDGVEKYAARIDAEAEKDRDKAAANRRLILTALALPILVFLIQLYIQAQLGGHA